jgi:Fic family protein
MEAALQLADHLDVDAILRMHEALMAGTDPAIAGTFRNEPVWIGGSSIGPHQAMFVPPHQRFIEAAIDDLVDFLSRDDIPVLAHATIAHAQFETIHPFVDGNGRTGRALVHALLRAKRLTRTLTVPVSAGLLVDVEAYFDALTSYRAGDIEPIINRFAVASFAATENGRLLAADLRSIREGWDSRVQARRDSRTWQIADLLLRQPVINAAVLVDALGVGLENVYAPLRPLLAAEVLVTTKEGRRNQVWRAPEVLRALDDFAARSGRRRTARPNNKEG